MGEGWKDTDTYTAENGWIDADKIKKYCYAPADDTAIFVCGLPIMYDLWCGPRSEAEVQGHCSRQARLFLRDGGQDVSGAAKGSGNAIRRFQFRTTRMAGMGGYAN